MPVSFDAIARPYRFIETITFGGSLQRARTACLDAATSAKRAVIVGEGDGRFLAALLATNREVVVDCVDGSPRMLELARARLSIEHAGRVTFIVADALAWRPTVPYDLVVTHFLLDCFDAHGIETIVEHLAQPSVTTWLLADFTLPATRVRRLHARLWLWVLYAFFAIVTGLRTRALVDPEPSLGAHGFVRSRRITTRFGLLASSVYQRG